MKRSPTIEQKQAAAARREKMRLIAKRVSEMSPEARQVFAERSWPTTIEGRPLSQFNACMVLSQNPNATLIGGFRQWIKAGRAVRKGEHGMAIWVPVFQAADAKGMRGESEPTGAEMGTSESGARFILGTVFDVTQTDEIESPVLVA